LNWLRFRDFQLSLSYLALFWLVVIRILDREPQRVHYLLRYQGQMIAVLEAKSEGYAADAGLEQAKSYATMLDVPFAYTSNGHSFIEFDFFLNMVGVN